MPSYNPVNDETVGSLDAADQVRTLVLRRSRFSASVVFVVGGEIVDPGTVAVTVTRDDGTALTDGTATGSGADARLFALTAEHTALLDVLTIDWTSSTYGTLTTHVEIVGGFLFGLGQLDVSLDKGGESGDDKAAEYELALKEAARVVATDTFERECRVAFAPRYARETFDGVHGPELWLPTPRVSAVRSVSIDGTAIDVSDVKVTRHGSLYRRSGWYACQQGIEVTWEHGWPSPPAGASRAGVLVASSLLADGPFDDRGMGVTGDGGMVRLLTAGVGSASFSIPEVQAAMRRHRHPLFA